MLVTVSFNESPEQKESFVVLKIGFIEGYLIKFTVSDDITHPKLSVLVTNNFALSVNILFATLVRSVLEPKYHFIVSPLLTLVMDSFKESPEQKESFVVLKIGFIEGVFGHKSSKSTIPS